MHAVFVKLPLFSLLFYGVLVQRSKGSCDADFVEWGSACYFIGDGKNYEEAREDCRRRGASLASIHSRKESQFLIELSGGKRASYSFYIGLNRLETSTYTWEDGSPLVYTSWHIREPNNRKYFCAEAIYLSGKIGWRDKKCDTKSRYACKKNIGLCFSEGGECKIRRSNCCKETMLNDPYWCNGDNSKICCLPFNPREVVEEKVIPEPESGIGSCSPKHRNVLCYAKEHFDVGGFTEDMSKPFQQISAGCNGSKLARSPDCRSSRSVCLKHRILNLLQCYSNACAEPLQLSSLLESCSEPDCADFCNGKSIRVLVPHTCNLVTLEHQCKDINGTSYTELHSPTNNVYFTCTYQ